MNILNRIKELRQKNNLTLKQLGNELNMLDSTLSQYENEKRKPKLEVWQKIANYFDVTVPYLKGLTYSKDEIFKIINDEYLKNIISEKADPFSINELIDSHLKIVDIKKPNELFSVDELHNFKDDVRKFWEDNFEFIFITEYGQQCLNNFKADISKKYIILNLYDAINPVDIQLKSTKISELFDKEVAPVLEEFCRNQDYFLRLDSKLDISIKLRKLILTLGKFGSKMHDLPENSESQSTPEIARKRLKKLVEKYDK